MLKQHPTHKHLYLSQNGDVYSTKTNKYLATVLHKNGYFVFCTKLGGRSSKAVLLRVHRLVAETYLPNMENKPFVNHKDGNKQNNKVNNLEWVTAKENSIHAVTNLLWKPLKRDNNPCAKLTEAQITKIKSEYIPYDKKYGTRALAKKYAVAHTTISRLIGA